MKKIVFTAIILFATASATGFLSQDGKAAFIELSGTITPSESSGFTSSGISPEQVRELNSKALNQGADTVIYEINSGGGAVVASKEVYRSIEDMDVPTVCRMRDTAASGGYLIALGCDRIVADSSTLTGSIGVKSSYIQLSGTMDKIGAEYINISAGENKEIGNQFMNASEEEKQLLKDKVDTIQEDFLNTVEDERNLSQAELERVKTGEPFLGSEAENLSLVDRLGGRGEAVKTAENLTGKDLRTFKVEKDPGFNFLSMLTADLSIENLFGFSSPFRSSTGY